MGSQDNIFTAIIKGTLAYDFPQVNIWLAVGSIIHPLRNTLGPNFSAMKRTELKQMEGKEKQSGNLQGLKGLQIINQAGPICI